jgi:hypothetical protein
MALRKLGVVAASALAFSAGTGGAIAATHHGSQKAVKHVVKSTKTTSTPTTTNPCPNMPSSTTAG